ncbi:unnamed protein product [Clonostachys byssicola]|uniref:Uncharacterized protein n=1 Tax=Clonostachys byssicola TaxID=160290 RepID=A0A9N9Y8B0_9HYPO|nr:unnamed protein product [Clonostachys byssicola]
MPNIQRRSGGLETQDIVGIAVGVPAAIFAFISAIIALCAWKFPKSIPGQVGASIARSIRPLLQQNAAS